jgi:hypothetical protein
MRNSMTAAGLGKLMTGDPPTVLYHRIHEGAKRAAKVLAGDRLSHELWQGFARLRGQSKTSANWTKVSSATPGKSSRVSDRS